MCSGNGAGLGGNRPLMQLSLAPTCSCSKKGPKDINAPGTLGRDQQERVMVEKKLRALAWGPEPQELSGGVTV